ncbi:MAG TPA: hypothetical protein VFE98_10615 [Candidatus Bathyarchaeia archaeon]|nr:hypothetical protein [Candidatus Bathyarchaeia archaeon]
MLRITVQVTNMTGERYWSHDSQLPAQVQIAVNINIVGVDQRNDTAAEAPFVFTVTYTPSIAQLSIKGKAQVNGEKSEISQIIEEHKKNKPPPTPVIQAVSSIAMAEAILLSKSLGIPPPLPPIGVPGGDQPQTQAQPAGKREPRYTT